MSASSSQPRTEGWAARGSAGYPGPGMRISDAERAAVADRLSKHYGEGRLDQAEFNERLDQAMRAKTRADLDGLFADLPDAEPPGTQAPGSYVPPTPPVPMRSRRRHRLAFLVLVVVLAAAAGHAAEQVFVPWVWVALVIVLVMRFGPRLRRR